MPKKIKQKKAEKKSLQASIKELEAITAWFEKDSDFDIEEGMKKVRDGAALVQSLKTQLTDVENEFREIQREQGLDS
jgi:exonuclease VII small subunit